jgi:Zn-dependent alcohol dehydrogenase
MAIEEVTIDSPGPNEALVEIAAVAICHSDVTYLNGSWGGPLPAIYGHEASGFVTEVGPKTSFRPGDFVAVTLVRSCGECFQCRAGSRHLCDTNLRLDREPPLRDAAGDQIWQAMSTGAFAERALVHESQLAPLPAGMSVAAGALLACGVVTGFGAVHNTAKVPAGATVAVVGTGGVGLNCIQGAAHAAAGAVIAIDLRDAKLDMARTVGATATVNPTAVDPVAAVHGLTEGRGVDYAFVSVGSSRAIEQALPLLRRGGTLVIVGLPPTGDNIQFDPGDFAARGQRILGSLMGSVRVADDIPMLANLYQQGKLELDRLITQTFPLDQINEAVESARGGEAIRNVVVFDR